MPGCVNGQAAHQQTRIQQQVAAPVIANNGPDDVGQGRLLPSMAVDQFGATLASWFGVSPTDLASVLPNIGNYSTRDLGFMAA